MNTIPSKLLSLLLICMLLVPFSACGGDPTPADTAPTPADTTTEATETQPSTPPDDDNLDIWLQGIPIEDYTVVIPAKCDLYTQYAAQNLLDYLRNTYAITLKKVTDAREPVDYELLIGATNRKGSTAAAAVELESDEFVMMRHGTSIVLYGESYMVGGAAADLIYRHAADARLGKDVNITDIPTEAKAEEFVYEPAQNAILLIGDGMGRAQIDLTLANGLEHFYADAMPIQGYLITKSQSVIDGHMGYTDSAAAATALATGYKTKNAYVGVLPDKTPVQNIREYVSDMGGRTAILSSKPITDATPAAFLAHEAERSNVDAVVEQINEIVNSGKVDVAKGELGDSLFFSESVKALQTISSDGSRFFAMIEEGQIDGGGHNNNVNTTIKMVKRLNELVAYCMEFVLFHPDTALIVTADHETGGLTYDAASDTFTFTTTEHTNVDVPLYAMGSGTEYFHEKTRDNTRVAAFLASIYGAESFGDTSYDDRDM